MASTLAAMAKVGLAVGCVCSLEAAGRAVAWALEPLSGTIHKPVLVAIYNGAIDFCEGHCASRVVHGDNREKGVGRQARDDMGCLCTGWEI